jgi:peroxiredoxin
MFDKPEVEVQERTIAMGAGHWLRRYAVVQDGRVKELFVDREDAERLMTLICQNWAEKE